MSITPALSPVAPTLDVRRAGGVRAARQALRLLVTMAAVLTVTFLLVHMVPGDPVRQALGPNASQELVAQRRATLGLDRPLAVQYRTYWSETLRGRFGTSIVTNLPVGTMIASRLPKTVELVGVALPLAMLLAIGSGLAVGAVTHAGRRHRLLAGFRVATSTLTMVPEYFYGFLLVVVFAIWLGWLPAGGAGGWQRFVLPVLAMVLGPAAAIARLVRSRMNEVLAADYITIARSKRLPTHVLYLRHALPNVLTEALTLGGLLVGSMIAGSVIVETVFARPGIGSLLVESLAAKDYPVVQACLLLLSAVILVVNAVLDVVLTRIDPRSTLSDAES